MRRIKPANFEKNTAGHLLKNNHYVQWQPRRTVPRNNDPLSWGGGVVLRLTTALTAISGSTPGTGSAKIQKLVSGSYEDLVATTPPSYDVQNITDKEIVEGTYILCITCFGYFQFVTCACSGAS